MISIQSITSIFLYTTILTWLDLTLSMDQLGFGGDLQLSDISPNDAMVQKYFEDNSKGWIEQGDVRQPKVDVQLELSKLNFSHKWEDTWPTKLRKLGSVSAVSFDNAGNVVVFHRGDHIWDGSTFSTNNVYLPRSKGPIIENTIVAFDRRTGAVAYEWGAGMFYMPHGLTVDHENNVWITDVGLHQVMKFNPKNRTAPELTLGIAFQPGNTIQKFCKPTAVAVLPNGDFFVSDGYCNARIIKYSRSGERILSWGHNSFQGNAFDHAPRNFFAIPHAMALASDLGLLCVADRENGRVQCFNTGNGTFRSQFHSGIIGDRLFSVAYAPINGGQLYVVNGPEDPQSHHPVMGFIIHMQTSSVIGKFGPKDGVFENPHDIIVSPDGNEIYVAQLAPNLVFKFKSKNAAVASSPSNTNFNQNSPAIASKPAITLVNNTTLTKTSDDLKSDQLQTSRQMLLIIGLFVSFVCITLFAVWIVARRRKLDSRNRRRHAWDFPTVKTDGFKLGNLLERKRGFEKLDQEASDRSDDEPNSSTNALLSNTQFT